MEKNRNQLSFSGMAVSKRKIKNEFFDQMNTLLDWKAIEKELKK